MDWQQFLKDRQATLASGLIAILIIVVGFLIFNYFSRKEQTSQPTQTVETQEATPSGFLANENTPKGEVGPENKSASISLPTNYEIVQGDHLWGIAEKFYGDGYQWTELAKVNSLANPNLIYAGHKLNIPKLEVVAQTQPPAKASAGNVKYTVKGGDSLWGIAESYYNSGFEWYRIRDANKDRVGTLPNGRPLIEPGVVLTVP